MRFILANYGTAEIHGKLAHGIPLERGRSRCLQRRRTSSSSGKGDYILLEDKQNLLDGREGEVEGEEMLGQRPRSSGRVRPGANTPGFTLLALWEFVSGVEGRVPVPDTVSTGSGRSASYCTSKTLTAIRVT